MPTSLLTPDQRARLTEVRDAIEAVRDDLDLSYAALGLAMQAVDELLAEQPPLRPRGVPTKER